MGDPAAGAPQAAETSPNSWPEIRCAVCGLNIERTPGRGRPPTFHMNCGELFRALRRVAKYILYIDEMTPEARCQLRSWLWRIANMLNERET